MSTIYLAVIILLCIAGIGWSVDRPSRIYQFPFVMAGIFAAFLVPQGISLILNPILPSPKVLERALLMSALCLLMCLLSYALPTSAKVVKALSFPTNEKKLFQGGLLLAVLGFFFSRLALATELTLNARGQLTGLRTIYSTFSHLSVPGLAILLLLTLKRPNFTNIAATLFACVIPVYRIIAFGRRETIATFLLTIGLALFFRKRWTVPRPLAIAAVIFALLAIPLIGQYRSVASSGNWDQLWNLKPIENLKNVVGNASDLELEYAALQIDATIKTQQYGYGTGYWNILVFRFIPAQLLGSDLKEGLMLRLQELDLRALYNYVPNPGLVPTGIADTFREFDYFGCLVFVVLGLLIKTLWVSAVRHDSILSQVLYITFLSGSMKAVTHGTGTCLSDFVFYTIFVLGVALYARRKVPTSKLNYVPRL
ncbi:hypothetical protein LEP3755_19190 [Leptolyngbya sp. NIES-3755]|nr:hypothetical protein LEP3755_19190 [Leptolyngbya sp. NIES-3755]